jgi:ABC-type transport system involved in multi-copper enzyme maturation permease subunit
MDRLLDPLVSKELTSFSRRWQTYFARVVYVGLIGILLFWFWGHVRVTNISELANLGRGLFQAFFWVQFAWVSATAMFGAVDLVAREVRSGMMGLLALTPLDADEVAWGKWKAAMAGSLSLVLCGVPVAAVCVYAGGIGLEELCWSTALTAATAALCAAHGILGAARSPTPVGGLLRAGGGIAKAFLLFTVVTFVFGPVFSAPFHPFFAGVAVVQSGGLSVVLAWLWIITLPFCLWRAGRILALAQFDLRARGFGGPIDAPPDPRLGTLDPMLRFLHLTGFRALEPPPWLLEASPLVWKELVSRASARAVRLWQVPAAFLVTGAALFGLTQGPAPGIVAAVFFVALLVALASGSDLFASERDRRRWDGLLAAPLSASRIVAAKLVSPLLTPEAAATLAVVALTVAGWGGVSRLEQDLPGTILAFLLFLAFAYALAAFASLHARTSRAAFLASSGVVFAILGLWATSLLPPWLEELNPTAWLFDRRARPFSAATLSVTAGATVLLVVSTIASLRRAAAR